MPVSAKGIMRCPKCNKRMFVTHKYMTAEASTQRVECKGCLKIFTMVTFVANEDPPRGSGASSLAIEIRQGKATPVLKLTK